VKPISSPRENSFSADFQEDAGKGDCAGCDCGFFLKTAAEIKVITKPIGKGSMNVISALKKGLSYSSLYFFSS